MTPRPIVQLRLQDSTPAPHCSIVRHRATAMEDKTVHLNSIKARVGRADYRVDERAVAEAIIRRLADARLWLGRPGGMGGARPAGA